ncbi:hypothetical protein [Kaistella polysaccharea]|uniref:hypothetical protein n=1 Tax=Kaistella polysaccharea TaxID=2878534 RepID=UPI001CF54CD5|nr:hypothetical protein [Kaistella polysaccharea]
MKATTNRIEILQKIKQEQYNKKLDMLFSKMRFQLLFRLREEGREFCKMVGYDYEPITQEELKEVEFLKWEVGLIKSHSLSSDEVKTVERLNIKYFLKIFYGILPSEKPTDEVARKIEKTLCGISPETISELRKNIWIKPTNHPEYRTYSYENSFAIKIKDHLKCDGKKLNGFFSKRAIDEIERAFLPC